MPLTKPLALPIKHGAWIFLEIRGAKYIAFCVFTNILLRIFAFWPRVKVHSVSKVDWDSVLPCLFEMEGDEFLTLKKDDNLNGHLQLNF